MKKTVIILIILLSFSCDKKVNQQNFANPTNSDVCKIISKIIENDSLQKTSNDKLFLNVKKFTVNFTESNKSHVPKLNVIYDFEIKSSKMIFEKADLEYINFQNKHIQHYQLDENLLRYIEIIDKNEIQDVIYYEFSFPVFNFKNSKAYVKLKSYISGNFLDSREYILWKTNEKWQVVEKDILFTH